MKPSVVDMFTEEIKKILVLTKALGKTRLHVKFPLMQPAGSEAEENQSREDLSPHGDDSGI